MLFIHELPKEKQKELKELIDKATEIHKKEIKVYMKIIKKIRTRIKWYEEIKKGNRPIEDLIKLTKTSSRG